MSTPHIHRMLDVSSAHISTDTWNMLDDEWQSCNTPLIGLSVYQKDCYGFIVYLVNDEIDLSAIPSDLANIIRYAQTHNCDVICIDRDADIYPDLEVINRD